MLYKITTGHGVQRTPPQDIVILVSTVHKVAGMSLPLLIADRHAFLVAAEFSADLRSLLDLDWNRLRRADFKRQPEDSEPFDRYQAEALVKGNVPVAALERIVCYGREQHNSLADDITSRGLSLRVEVRPQWLFG